ncbi:hypothetical protein E2C01_057194 [Portunus trituberculatus]|uniref:Uncharacterized protein n=1 Tax=Portunus trituberculatus TaxID=210409 RepID=A0A5B7GSC4_PORTR|nr:hypothetical protein [Portunus trituberculatus]
MTRLSQEPPPPSGVRGVRRPLSTGQSRAAA